MSTDEQIRALQEEGIRLLAEKDAVGALSAFERAIALHPGEIHALYGQAVALGRLGRLDEAVTVLEKLVTADQEHQKARLLLGELNRALNDSSGGAQPVSPRKPSALTDTAVLFLIFNRPDHAARVMETIQELRPRQLFIAADGPREKDGESALVERCRNKVLSMINWECEVQTLFRSRNLGCKHAVSSAISWFFDSVEEGIILEDDTKPSPEFFCFCSELLEKYRHDSRIAVISGNNFQNGRRRTDHSYYFSRFNHIWGWASWRRAWQHYDPAIPRWPEFRDGRYLEELFGDENVARYWTHEFDRVQRGEVDTWDYQWTFTCWSQGMVSILPQVNLVTNIGFGPEATHTTTDSPFSNMPVGELSFPLKHPPFVLADTVLDSFTHAEVFHLSLGEFLKSRASFLQPARVESQPPETVILELQDLMNRGIDLLNTNDDIAALACFSRARAMGVPVLNLHYVRALCLIRMARVPEALEALREELALFPDNQPVRALLAEVSGGK